MFRLILMIQLFFIQSSFALDEKFEIKLRIAPDSIEESLSKLNLTKSNSIKEKIYVLDTKNLELRTQGIFLRLKINEKTKEIQTNIKVNGLNSETIDPRFHTYEGLKCETNLTPLKKTQSCAISETKNLDETALFNHFQTQFLNFYSKISVNIPELLVSKPFYGYEWEIKNFGELKKAKIELWEITPDKHFLEISYKVKSRPEADLKKGIDQLDSLGIPLDPNPASRLNSVEF